MSTVNVYPANLQWIGLAKETTYGTPVATPTFWLPVDGSSISYKPNINPLTDTSYRGLMSGEFTQSQGMRNDTLDFTSYMFLDSMYLPCLAMFGRPDAVTGASDPYTHKTSVENGVDNAQAQPMSFTLFYADGTGNCFQIPGCMIASLKVDVKVDDLVKMTQSWIGLPAIEISPPTNTPTTNKAIPSWNSTISLAGSPISQYSEMSIEYKRDAAPVETINNSQSVISIFSGGITATVTLDAVYQGAADPNLVKYFANTQGALSLKVQPQGDSTHYLLFQHSVFAFDSAAPVGTNKWMTCSVTGKMVANTTDALDTKQSLGQVQFLTSVSAAY